VELEGRAALVTGASRGVGRATALALAQRGCAVAVNCSRSVAEGESVVEEIRRLGARATLVPADVADDAACREMVGRAVSELGRLDLVVNNAGTTRFIPHHDLDAVATEDFDRILAVNLRGPFQVTRAARSALEEAGGEVVMVSSVAGVAGAGSSIPYCASKGALNNLTLTLARALAPRVRVNAIAPGFIEGAWLRQGLGAAYEPVKRAMEERALLGRVCTPEEVAAAILAIVAGPDLVTGQILVVDGGMLLGR